MKEEIYKYGDFVIMSDNEAGFYHHFATPNGTIGVIREAQFDSLSKQVLYKVAWMSHYVHGFNIGSFVEDVNIKAYDES